MAVAGLADRGRGALGWPVIAGRRRVVQRVTLACCRGGGCPGAPGAAVGDQRLDVLGRRDLAGRRPAPVPFRPRGPGGFPFVFSPPARPAVFDRCDRRPPAPSSPLTRSPPPFPLPL